MLCMIIVLIQEDTEENLEGINTEVVPIRGKLEESTSMLHRCRYILVGFTPCPLKVLVGIVNMQTYAIVI